MFEITLTKRIINEEFIIILTSYNAAMTTTCWLIKWFIT